MNPTDASNTARFPENMAPSAVNNGARALEGLIARYFFDNDTSVVATISASLITITANRNSLTLTGTTSNYVANFMQGFAMGANPNTGPVRVTIDGVGPISVRDNYGVSLSSSIILAGTRVLIVKDAANNYFRMLYPFTPRADWIAGLADTVITASDLIAFGDATDGNSQKRDTVQGILDLGGLSRAYLAGLGLSNGTDATNDINIAVGTARSDVNDADLTVGTAIGKRIDASFAIGGTTGTPTGGLSSSLTLANDTWYHLILGLISGTAEIGFDTSITGANLVTDHSFTNTRRIGSVRRGTATILGFSQEGDDFLLDDPPLDIDVTNPGTSAVTRTLTVPLGVKVMAHVQINMDAGQVAALYLSSPDANDEAASITAAPLGMATVESSAADPTAANRVRTNTSSQIRSRISASDASNDLRIATLGWTDRRGRDS